MHFHRFKFFLIFFFNKLWIEYTFANSINVWRVTLTQFVNHEPFNLPFLLPHNFLISFDVIIGDAKFTLFTTWCYLFWYACINQKKRHFQMQKKNIWVIETVKTVNIRIEEKMLKTKNCCLIIYLTICAYHYGN